MVESGVPHSADVTEKFDAMKLRKEFKFLICKIENEAEIICEHAGGPDATYDECRSLLPPDEPRFVVFDYDLKIENENPPRVEQKLTFIHWVPETSKPRNKMASSSSKEPFKRALVGVQKDLQATDPSEIEQSFVEENLRRK